MPEHASNLSSFLLAFASALLAAKLLGEIPVRFGQPAAFVAVVLALFATTFLTPPLLALLVRAIPSARSSANVSARDNKETRV